MTNDGCDIDAEGRPCSDDHDNDDIRGQTLKRRHAIRARNVPSNNPDDPYVDDDVEDDSCVARMQRYQVDGDARRRRKRKNDANIVRDVFHGHQKRGPP